MKRCVIKIGSNVLTSPGGAPDLERLGALVEEIAELMAEGVQVLLISSGAVAFGRQSKSLQGKGKADPILRRQLFASVGQIPLMQAYAHAFQRFGLSIGQLLVTKEDFRDRKHYVHMQRCMEGLLSQGIVPILNENDVIAITELMFTDNDELASLTAALCQADTLILLTNVAGVYTGAPSDPSSQLIREVQSEAPLDVEIAQSSSLGRGGMASKLAMARKAAELGIGVFIANGKEDRILGKIFRGEAMATFFHPQKRQDAAKRWLAYGSSYYKGEVWVNAGAQQALLQPTGGSLLLVGIEKINGHFDKGDIVQVCAPSGQAFGLGRAEYPAEEAVRRIGEQHARPFIHVNYLYLFHHDEYPTDTSAR
ncbi:MAG: glutamate 5-kinase [Nitritalea sp.]